MKPFSQLRRDLREDVLKQLESIIKKDEPSKITLKNGSQVEIDPDAANHLLKAFKKLSPERILAFLGNESKFLDDIKIMNSLPKIPFLIAGIKSLK